MNKQCARCSKTVYPLEELKCLDKVWHKGCFKCWECGMTLNMRTYKGFNKFPYCEAHIPKPKATTVTETPEMQRLAENTKIQSNIKYHAEFEKAKGKYTTVADDPETMRIKEASKIISNVTYHGALQHKAEMEMKRNLTPENGGEETGNGVAGGYSGGGGQYQHQQQTSHQQHHHQPPQPVQPSYGRGPRVLPPGEPHPAGQQDSPYSARQSSTIVYTSQKGSMEQPAGPQRHIGSIADYDPMGGDFGRHPQQQGQYRGGQGHGMHPQQLHMQQQQQQRGYPSSAQGHGQQPQGQRYAQQPEYYHQQQQPQQPPPQSSYGGGGGSKLPPSLGRCYRAMYDYAAADADEVSFRDGDLIINCSAIDEGWMTGTVQRTMHTGMLPANYVELAN